MGAALLLQACRTGPERRPAGDPPRGHCLRLAGLNDQGGAAVIEAGTPSFTDPDEGRTRYHLTADAAAPVLSVTGAQCEAEGACGPAGLRLEALELSPPEAFLVGVTEGAGSVEVSLPVHGRRTATLALAQDRFEKPAWTLSVAHQEEAWVLYRAPGTLAPRRTRWFRAGDLLWLEVEADSRDVSCLVLRADLREAAAGMLDDAAVDQLQAKNFTKAEALLRQAIEVRPEDSTAAYNLACALALQARPEEAMQWLERSFLLDDQQRLRQLARRDPDLESLWSREDFLFLVSP